MELHSLPVLMKRVSASFIYASPLIRSGVPMSKSILKDNINHVFQKSRSSISIH
ncbi:hypothetical protein GGD54_002878 [Rhizobium tropici]|uniref:Uncharacterized protein n=1 Tax=Rhizobium tropici TaxID=398 RepID=A0ABR6QZZ1_RHITR|nr:hypothetical protein [Rhizobium tropici]MBB5593827.1 hypothetical protein [Rhizobium tropici]MBB6492473.1 hypothetical protein [Rhizobium tropici]